MFYFSFLNLPPHFNSSLSNNHLYATANKVDFRGEGQDILLDAFVEEVMDLCENVMEVHTPNRNLHVFASLASVFFWCCAS
jgi:hypothetical protein